MKTPSYAQQIVAVAHQKGIAGLAKKLAAKIWSVCFYTTQSTWYACDLKKASGGQPIAADVQREFLSDDKKRGLIDWLQKNREEFPWIYFEQEIDSALANPHIFYVMKDGGRIVGYVKCGVRQCYIHDFAREVALPDSAAFIYDTFVHPDYRGRSLASLALYDVIQYFRNQGFHQILCHIEDWNHPSIKVFSRAGFHEIDIVRFVRLVRFPFFVHKKGYPFLDMDQFLKKVVAR
ncbi:MAG: GNAT family N-acetyltransferase [Desulfuromonadales bacterium]